MYLREFKSQSKLDKDASNVIELDFVKMLLSKRLETDIFFRLFQMVGDIALWWNPNLVYITHNRRQPENCEGRCLKAYGH